MGIAAAAKPLPVYSIEQIANYLTKGYWKDQNPDWQARSWGRDDHTITFNIDAFTTEYKQLARLAFATWDEISGLSFVEISGSSAMIDFTANDFGPDNDSFEQDNVGDGRRIEHATINIDPTDTDTQINSTLTETFIHEIGHALGLGHGGNYNGSGGRGAPYQNDTRQFSVMSYGAQGSFGGATGVDVLTPQMADIYAMIKKYGSADVRSGDTTYGFNSTGQNAGTAYLYDFNNFQVDPASQATGWAPTLTIVDTGGIDTLDLSGYAHWDQTIDLRGGHWSSAGQFKKNIGIYTTTVIENAVGGRGDDSVTGNKVANNLDGGMGEDSLNGLGGNDFLTGGGDADTFEYARKGKIDHITDFADTVDLIDLSSMDFKNFAKVDKLAKDVDTGVGTDLVINFGKGDRLIIDNFSKAFFDDADIVL